VDEPQVVKFLSRACALFDTTVLFVKKCDETSNARFIVTRFAWLEDHYVAESTYDASTAPKDCIWGAKMESSNANRRASHARIFQRPTGQIVMRVAAELGVDRGLTFFRIAASQVNLSAAKVRDIQNPLVRIGMTIDIHIASRVIAKIGLNLLIHVAGHEYLRQPAFDSVKHSILRGFPRLPLLPQEMADDFFSMFAGVPRSMHAFMLHGTCLPDGTFTVTVIARLYGIAIDLVKLAEKLEHLPIELPAFFTIDYATHVVQRHSPGDFMTKFPPLRPAASMSKG
jgi:hypothetical protein